MKSNLETYWAHINAIEIKARSPELDFDEVAGMITDSTYFPIDVNFCIVETDGLRFFLRAQNGVIYSVEEMVV